MKKIVIIGGGITGLSAGIFALKKGYSVSIYEKNSFAGGCCSGWIKDGYYIDNCMHWLTGTNHTTNTFKLWKSVGAISETSNLYQSDYFYKSIYNKDEICLYKDLEKTKDEMIKLSAIDKDEIVKFINTVTSMKKFQQEENFTTKIFNKPVSFLKAYFIYRHLSLKDLSDKFKHPLLKKVFTDFLPKDYNALALIYSYATFASGNGKVYTKGSKAFANNILDKYIKMGGFIHFNSELTKINIIDNKVANVVINDSEIVVADEYIYTSDLYTLYNKFLDNELMPKGLNEKFENNTIYSSFHAAYLVDKKINPFSDTVIIEIPKTQFASRIIDRLMIKDYSYLYPDKSKTILQIFIPQNKGDYEYWENLSLSNHDLYEEKKVEFSNLFKTYIEESFPKLKNNLKLLDSWTPITYHNYYNSYYGSYMGFTFRKDSTFKESSFKAKFARNLRVASYWNKITGGLPVSVKMGRDVIKSI